jgi:pimeloyl-ACP methyl ester carboxylesterase
MICVSPSQTLCDRQFLWIGTNPSLQCFHRRLLGALSQPFPMKYWEYAQTPDEPGSLDAALTLLHEYISTSDQLLHLIGHGQGGVLALSYARRYPERVASVVLLSVAAQPVITWQSYYYQQLAYWPYSRQQVLEFVASKISAIPCARYIAHLAQRLDRDLLEAPSSNSPLRKEGLLAEGMIVQPLLVYSAEDDPVLAGRIFEDWKYYLKPGDQMWLQPVGGHFFHHQYAELVSEKISSFWQQLPDYALPCLIPAVSYANP